MLRTFVIVLSFLAFLAPARAEVLSPDDTKAVQQVIEAQLNALAGDRGDEAYAFAAPIVKFAFPDSKTFMKMVIEGYEPVYRNNGHQFGELFTDGMGRPSQKVVLMGQDGRNYEAVYFMEKQPDGMWKIAGVVVRLLPETNA